MDPISVIEGGGNQKENPAYGADTLRLWVSGENERERGGGEGRGGRGKRYRDRNRKEG